MTASTPNLLLPLQATGDNVGLWGNVVNTQVFSVLDLQLGGRNAPNVAGSSDYTLSTDEAKCLYQAPHGTLTGNISYIFPASSGRDYIVFNNTAGSFTLTVKPSGGAGIVVPQGSSVRIFINPDNAHAVYASGITSGQMDSAFGSTQGDLLYRGNSVWGVLTPGTAGQFLTSGGASANIAWASYSDAGTWTPTLSFSTPGTSGFGPITTLGTYTKIGRRVFADYYWNGNATIGTASGFLRMGTLPVTPRNLSNYVATSIVMYTGILPATGAANPIYAEVISNTPNVAFFTTVTSGSTTAAVLVSPSMFQPLVPTLTIQGTLSYDAAS